MRALSRTIALVILIAGFGVYLWRTGSTADWQGELAEQRTPSLPATLVMSEAVAKAEFELATPVWTAMALPTPTTTLTPIIVPPAPTVADVFEAATRVVEWTRQAERIGTATPTPPNLVTATFTPPPYVVIDTPTPANAATATYEALLAEAIAATTGTPTPLPAHRVTATPRMTSTPYITGAGSDTWGGSAVPTATPIFVRLDDQEALDRVVWPSPTAVPTPTAIPDVLWGKIAFKSDMFGYQRILVVDADGSNPALLTSPWAYDVTVDRRKFSPDGRTLLLQAFGKQGLDLFITPVEGGQRHQLTYVGRGVAYDAAWAPDGRSIVFASNQEGHDDLFIVSFGDVRWPNPNTTKLTTRVGTESFKHPSFSPDGSQIVFYSNQTGRFQLGIINVDGTNQRLLFESAASCWDPVWLKP